MPITFILARVRHHWRYLAALTVVVALLAGFAAFYPLYSGVLSEAHVANRVDSARALDFELNVRNAVDPIVPEVETALQDDLGNLYESYTPVTRTSGVICGLSYPNPFNCFQFATYDDLDALVTLTEGDLPGLRESRDGVPQIEAVVMPRPAHLTQTEIGRTATFGEADTAQLGVEIVGIVEPAAPDDVFWSTQANVVQGIKTPVGSDYRDDVVLIIPPEAFTEHIAPLYRESLVYSWRVSVDPAVIDATNLADLENRIRTFEQSYFQLHPDGSVDNSLLTLVGSIRAELDAAMSPVFTFALVIGAWLLCLVFYLSYLLFRAQEVEWQVLVERGIDLRQIALIQLGTVAGVALVAVIVAPLVAYGVLVVVGAAGPVALALQDTGRASIGFDSLFFALAAGVVALLVMIVAVWVQFRLEIEDSGNPTENVFPLHYFADFGVFLLGMALILRVYFLNSDNLSDSIERLFREPGALVTVIAGQGSTGDPLNLLGPVLVILALALFSLRLVPLILRLLATLPGGTLPLALRESRRMRRYGFPVLLLIVTALIGVAAYTLSSTYSESLWRETFLRTGGDARITFADNQTDVRAALDDLPETVVPVLNLTETNPPQITMLAVDPVQFADHYPAWSEALATITPEDTTRLEGFVLPENVAALSLQVYANTSDDQPATLDLFVTIEDALGVSRRIALQTDDPRNTGSFVVYRAELPEPLKSPWRMTALSFTSQRDDSTFETFDQIALIDTLTAISADGTETLIEDFEQSRLAAWQIPEMQESGLVAVRTDSLQVSGEASLRVSYEVMPEQNDDPPLNTIPVNTVARVGAIPVLVSQSLAETWGQTYNNRNPLPVGFEQEIVLPPGLGGLPVNLAVRAVVADFPTLMDGERFLVAPIERVRMRFNEETGMDDYYRWNGAFVLGAGREVNVSTQGDITYAIDRYAEQRRAPLENAFFGMLYSGFLLAFVAYGVVLVVDVIVQREGEQWRMLSMLGMSPRGIRAWKVIEVGAPLLTGLVLALVLGGALAVMLLPFLAVENEVIIPWTRYGLLWLASGAILLLAVGVVLARRYPEEMR